MRISVLLNITAGTAFGSPEVTDPLTGEVITPAVPSDLSPEVLATINQIQVGHYTANNLAGTRDYNGRAIIQAQIDVVKDMPTTVAMLEGMLVQFGLDWEVIAAMQPRGLVQVDKTAGNIIGTEEKLENVVIGYEEEIRYHSEEDIAQYGYEPTYTVNVPVYEEQMVSYNLYDIADTTTEPVMGVTEGVFGETGETYEKPIMVTNVYRKVPAGTENFMLPKQVGTKDQPVEEPAKHGDKLSTNYGDNDWVWEDL